jgi:acyl-coenzyme A thioesterase PaaI-like protein
MGLEQVDVLGSAVIAFGNQMECGVATNLSVEYLSPAKYGDNVDWNAEVLKRGKRLNTVEVVAKSASGRVLICGKVTKSLRGPARI